MAYLLFVSPTKVTKDGKSLTKFEIGHLIDTIRISYGVVPVNLFSKSELIGILRCVLSNPTFSVRINRLNLTFL